MELTQLRYFQIMATIKHFTKAAKFAAISQSALSRSIAKLEQEFGCSLFVRNKSNIELTPQGQSLLLHVERILKEADQALSELQQDNEASGGGVNLSFTHSLGGHVLPSLLKDFIKAHPHIKVTLNQHNSAFLTELLERGETDLCLCPTMDSTENIAWSYLWSEELFAAVPAGHELAAKSQLTLAQLEKYPLITLKPTYSLRRLVNQFFNLVDCHPKIIFEGDDISTVAGLVAADFGVSLIPRSNSDTPDICYIPIASPICKREIGIAWNTTSHLSPAALTFQQFIMQRLYQAK